MSVLDLPRTAADQLRRSVVRGALRFVPRVDQPELDPDLRRVARLVGMARSHEQPVALLRASYEADGRIWGGPIVDGVTTVDETITVTADRSGPTRSLQVRTYTPAEGGGAGMMYVHGGGFAIGSIGTHDRVCRRLAATSGVVLQSVEYRLAPEHPFPAGLTDIARLWAILRGRWADGGSDPERYGIGGDSAGGHASLTVADEAADPTLGVEVERPAFVFAIYPATDSTRSGAEVRTVLASGGILSGPMVTRFTQMHVGDAPVDAPALNPGLRSDEVLASHPRTWIQSVGFDPLNAQLTDYIARREALAGSDLTVAPLRHDHEPTMAHGYISTGGVSAGAAAVLHRAGLALQDLARP